MPPLILNGEVFELAGAYSVGQLPDAFAAAYLNNLRSRRLCAQMLYWLKRQAEPPTPADFQAELLRRAAAFDFGMVEDDEVEAEMFELATADIRSRLAADDLPLPKNLDDHVHALVTAVPAYRERAKARLAAKAAAAAAAASALLSERPEAKAAEASP
jgi:hypothetical protein